MIRWFGAKLQQGYRVGTTGGRLWDKSPGNMGLVFEAR